MFCLFVEDENPETWTGGGKASTTYCSWGEWHLVYKIMKISILPCLSTHVDFELLDFKGV